MLLLPCVGLVKPSDKKSLRTLEDDLEDFTRRSINMETGHIYIKDKVSFIILKFLYRMGVNSIFLRY